MMVSFSSLIGVVGDRVGARHKAPVGGRICYWRKGGYHKTGIAKGNIELFVYL